MMTPLTEKLELLQRGIDGLKTWQLVTLALLGLVACSIYRHQAAKINVPSVGVPPGIFGPWKAAFNFITQSEFLIREGYRKYGKEGKAFKISTPARYMVLLSNPKLIKELADTDDHIMSFRASGAERIAIGYTFSADLMKNPYHVEIIKKNLTNRLSTILPEVMSELTLAFKENTNIGRDWTSVDNFDVMLKCISRTTNRLFVGLPLCRDQDYLDHCIAFSIKASRSGTTIDMFPDILKPFVARILIGRGKTLSKVVAVIGPIFEERQQKLAELGDAWVDRPNDAIQWITEAAPPGSTIQNMCLRILFLNFLAIHSTSFSVTQVIFDLATAPEYQEPLRQEIETTITEFGGWTKQALTKMKKLDSVLRESQRLNGVTILTGLRKAMVSHTFSDGTHVPKGSWVFVPASAVHQDVDFYENPMAFDGFRFARMREQPGQEAKHQMVSTMMDYLAFGTGKYTCPGRFFAANELKLLMAYIILNYEFKTEDGVRPPNKYYATECVPDIKAKIIYRERKDRHQSFANSCIMTEA